MGKNNGNNAVSLFDMQFVTATISTTMVLLLLGMALSAVLMARNLSAYVRENICFSLVLDDGMDNRAVLNLQRRLEKQPFVKEMTYVSKEDALKDYIRETGTDPRQFAGFNPLRASVEIHLKSAYANTDSITRIESLLGQESHIKDIVYQQELVDAVNRNVGRISLLLLGLAALLLLVSFALINNTVKLTIYAKRFLIHTMQLVGAGWGLVCGPGSRCRAVGPGRLAGNRRSGLGRRSDGQGDGAGGRGGAGGGCADNHPVRLVVRQQVPADAAGCVVPIVEN